MVTKCASLAGCELGTLLLLSAVLQLGRWKVCNNPAKISVLICCTAWSDHGALEALQDRTARDDIKMMHSMFGLGVGDNEHGGCVGSI